MQGTARREILMSESKYRNRGKEMAEKRILIINDELLSKIDENKGDMSRAEFISFIINNQLQEEDTTSTSNQYVTREEYLEFTLGMKGLLRQFLDFFIVNGLKRDGEPEFSNVSELMQKLQSLPDSKIKSRHLK